MNTYKLGDMESRMAQLIWDNAPLTSKQLVDLCSKHFEWKRTTTYTMLKRLCERGIFDLTDSTVNVVMTREEYYASKGQLFLDESYEGSLPMFISRVTKSNGLTDKDIEEIQRIIDSYRESRDD